MKISFAEKRVLITGASSGLGRELALVLAGEGAKIALAARSSDKLKETAAAICQALPKAACPVIVPCDVTVPGQVSSMVQSAAEQLGGLDVLINNAGMGVYGQTRALNASDVENVMRVNYLGSAGAMLAALPFVEKQSSGLIVNIASVAALHGVPYMSTYCASKSALMSFSQSLRAELADTPVRVAIVYPGYLSTDFFAHEKKVGTATRPARPYRPVDRAARQIVSALSRGKLDIYITPESHALRFGERFFPGVVRFVMKIIARRLAQPRRRGA